MRLVKLGIISIIVFALLITGISLFFPSHVRISKAIDIHANKYDVSQQLTNSTNRQNWYTNPDSLAVFGKNGKVNLIVDVNSNSVSPRNLQISVVISDASFPDSKRTETGWNIIPDGGSNSVTVQWYMDFHLRWYPWEKFSSLLLEKRYGAMMEKGLTNLKALLEK